MLKPQKKLIHSRTFEVECISNKHFLYEERKREREREKKVNTLIIKQQIIMYQKS